MAGIHLSIVRPDRLVWEGDIHHVVLCARRGELGVWPLHAPEIVALGDGVMRIHEDEGASVSQRVVISGGYAEIMGDEVIILADHARRADDIEPDVVRATREKACAALDALDADSHRRAYYESKIAWCDLLLQCAEGSDRAAASHI